MSSLLTASRLKDARACARLHHLRYDRGYRSLHEASALRFGTLLHLGLEAWWRAGDIAGEDRLCAALEAMQGEADAFDRAKAENLLAGYHYRWEAEPYEVLAVEAPFVGPLVNPATGAASRTWQLAGKLDVLVRDQRDGLVRLVEHKTSSEDISHGSEYWRRLRMDGQVSVYYEGARLLGHDVAGCVYDVIGKPSLRPGQVPVLDENGEKVVVDSAGERARTKDGKRWRQSADAAAGLVLRTRPELPGEYGNRIAEAIAADPARYYQRGEVVRLEAEMREALIDVWQIGRGIRDRQVSGQHPRNPDACSRYGRTCEFFDVCAGQASLDDTTRFVRLADVHPELAGAAVEATPKEEEATT